MFIVVEPINTLTLKSAKNLKIFFFKYEIEECSPLQSPSEK